MIVTRAEVVRHFLKLEASRPKYRHARDELLSWCAVADSELLAKARRFADERDDVNPALLYTVGTSQDERQKSVASWARERIKCKDVFTPRISTQMIADVEAVSGNIQAFALSPARKYPEFRPLGPLNELSRVVIVVARQKAGCEGRYEVIDGAHRLVALCREGIEEVDAFVARLV